jgi:hypothetical protein
VKGTKPFWILLLISFLPFILWFFFIKPSNAETDTIARDRFVIECSGNFTNAVRACEVFDRKTKRLYIIAVSENGGIIRLDQITTSP